ncbi:MAG: hypothetical protein M1493_11775 [Firmicutes bacterium]|jgi:hypothetical protein|uniref:Uncharacterized protein n=1 Tax=Sulfobacillus benefaciens TaxID=453960 RepID=A0A2T2X7S1_9FIRM|nr:hypothetical protein [Bacillota bacterium]PSR30506.1 MAG: hypothetical protein C7B43_05355 [Sulfobacillus benefaciens]
MADKKANQIVFFGKSAFTALLLGSLFMFPFDWQPSCVIVGIHAIGSHSRQNWGSVFGAPSGYG